MNRTCASDKQALRRYLRECRASLSPEERTRAGERILEYVCAAAWWKRASVIHLYCSVATEVPTGGLMQAAFDAGKRVIVPITPPIGTTLFHAEIFPGTRFEPDVHGIPVPTPETSHRCEASLVLAPEDCIFVPLLGFDRTLHRLGYGGGFYDRFLNTFLSAKSNRPLFVGLAYSLQFVGQGVFAEQHDIALDCLVTEQAVITPSCHISRKISSDCKGNSTINVVP